MKHLKLFCFVLIWTTTVHSQNLVNNPSLELVSSQPTGYNQLNKALGWSNCNGNYNTQGTWGSPDLLSLNGTGVAQLPCGYVTCVQPHSGNNVVGFISYNGYIANCREYVSTNLNFGLQIGAFYSVSFWASTGSNPQADYVTNNIGALFTMNPFWYNTPCHTVNRAPHVNITSLLDTAGWKFFSFVFQADSAYNYITFGSFANDANTTLVQKKTTGMPYAYNVIDDIDVHKIVLAAPEANFVTSGSIVCVGVTVQASDGSSGNPTSWNWTVSGPTTFTSSLQNPVILFPQAGAYVVSLSCSNSAGQSGVYSKTITAISCETAIQQSSVDSDEFLVFPSPTQGSFVVTAKIVETLLLYNQLGKVISVLELNSENNKSVSVDDLEKGVYFLKGKNCTKKIIVVD